MNTFAPAAPSLTLSPDWRAGCPFADIADILSQEGMDRAQQEIINWPGYTVTPLRQLPGLAEKLGIAALWCKDEGQRFGLGGVKALGAPYGLHYLLRDIVPEAIAGIEAVAATDGNHGLALAWAARTFGCRARIFVGRGVDQPRLDRLTDAGAALDILDGTYDDAVLAAERYAAGAANRLLVTDTDYRGGLPVTRAIMEGYSLLGQELADQLQDQRPTHIMLQCGVGGMAAGVLAGYWQALGRLEAKVILVEPLTAACLQASLAAGEERSVPGDLETSMVGLACGRPSRPAWRILSKAAFAAIAMGETGPRALQAALWTGDFGDAPLLVGDTGVAGLAGLVAAASHRRDELGLGSDSRVLCVNSEPPLPGQFQT